MIHVVLDTSIFRHDPKGQKIPFRALSTLAQSGFLKIHIPYVVYKEFMSHVLKDYVDDFSKINMSIKSLLRKNITDHNKKRLKEINQPLDQLRIDVETELDSMFRQ